MPNYANGKIYKIVDNTNDNIYIGSTTKMLCARLSDHVSSYKTWLKTQKKGYTTSFEILKNGNFQIVLIENCPCDSKEQLIRRERYYIDTLQNCVNKVRNLGIVNELGGRKEYRKIRDKKYYAENAEIIKNKVKIYSNNNKELISKRGKIYREKNADMIKAHKNKICICECGLEYTNHHKQRHLRTTIHKNRMEQKPNL